MTTERSNWNLYFFGSTLVIEIDYLIRNLIYLFLDESKIMIRLIHSYRAQRISSRLRRRRNISQFGSNLLFVNLIDTNHQYFSSILFFWPVGQNISMFIIIFLVSSDSFDDQNVSAFFEMPMRNFRNNTVPRNSLNEMDINMVDVKVVFNIV